MLRLSTNARLLGIAVLAISTSGSIAAVTAYAAANGHRQTSTVSVVVKEMQIVPDKTSVERGRVTFVVRNAGSIEHEFVVIKSNRRPSIKNFRASEAGSIGEIEGIAPGKTKRGVMTLKPGKYFMICNIPGHYQLGMAAALTVR